MIKVQQIVNNPVASCCYVLWNENIGQECLIIDPASENPKQLSDFLSENHLTPSFIILTHEHFDHCMSVNFLRESFPNVKLVCSADCNEAIQDEKKNCSVFWDNEKAFVIAPAEILTESIDNKLCWNKYEITIIPTPGHTKGSISILIDQYLFTGDAWIKDVKTVTKLPGGNKQQAAESEDKIKKMTAVSNLKICSGHFYNKTTISY